MKYLTEDLLQLGFVDFASWKTGSAEGTLSFLQNISADSHLAKCPNALYAFVRDQDVLYIGKTTRGVSKRFIGYCRPGKRQATNIRCHQKIAAALAAMETIRILIFVPISQIQYGEFPLDIAAGLEDSLISSFQPGWNARIKKRPVSEEEENEIALEEEIAAEAINPIQDGVLKIQKQQECSSFEIKLGRTYYLKGIINPGVDMNPYFGKDGDIVLIHLGNKENSLASSVNRTANPSGSVRILGSNQKIATWFQQNYKLGDVVVAEIVGKNEILLCAKG